MENPKIEGVGTYMQQIRNRMLHLMTTQVVTGRDSIADPPPSSTVPSLESLAKNVVKSVQEYQSPIVQH